MRTDASSSVRDRNAHCNRESGQAGSLPHGAHLSTADHRIASRQLPEFVRSFVVITMRYDLNLRAAQLVERVATQRR